MFNQRPPTLKINAKMIRNYPLHARLFVKRIIRIRKRLILNDESKLDHSMAIRIIAILEKYLDYYPFNTRQSMSKFVLRHASDIMYLIPGKTSKSHKRLMQSFNEIYSEAIAIKNEKPKPALI
ncbi:hypothetical protein ACT29H_09295 [Thermophagus sp. OGC60D27]|uniref:hypothetical protein n=1 Tax=Thermophagus sp. OGC60D27 TaxID=3458415 RepID=UPI004037AF27